MASGTPAEEALGRSYTTGDGAVRFGVDELAVDEQPDRTRLLTYHLTVTRPSRPSDPPERWAVTLPWDDKSFADVFAAAAPDPVRLDQLIHLVRAHLEEWWDTKAHNRRSATMGRRLP